MVKYGIENNIFNFNIYIKLLYKLVFVIIFLLHYSLNYRIYNFYIHF